MSRTERGLIAFALFLLVFAVAEFAAYDYLLAVAGPAKSSAIHLRRAEIYPGDHSLVVVDREGAFHGLRLKYGTFSAQIAVGGRFVFVTEAGEKFEIKGVEEAKIDVRRRHGNVVLRVSEGHIQFGKAGSLQSLVSRDEIQFANDRGSEINPLVFSAPKFSVRYSGATAEELEFSWQYARAKAGGPFLFEVSEDPSFKTIQMRRETAEPNIAVQLRFPSVVYYRVKDGQGGYSEIRRLNLLPARAPALAFAAVSQNKSTLNLKLTPESRATIQISKDPHFKKIFATRSGVASSYGLELPAGKYFARARLEYRQFNRDFTLMTSPWSESKALLIP